MNRFLIPLLLLLGSFLFSWHWNCNRAPHCGATAEAAVDTTVVAAPIADTAAAIAVDTTANLSTEEKVLINPLDVYFAVSKSGIARNEEINSWLATAKTYLEKYPNEKLSVTGHTDSDGDDASNQALSERRAATVKAILVKEGFNADNLVVGGKGESEPVTENDTPDNKAKNRRVSIRLIN